MAEIQALIAQAIDIVILSNGPGELVTWVKPVVQGLRQRFGTDRDQVRISVVLSPCPHATGRETDLARSYPEVDRVQGADQFFPFLFWGKTADNWDWRPQGIVIFLGGDQFFPVVIGKRLGYRTLIYAEWEARWQPWIDRFAVMKPEIREQAKPQYQHKFTVVGDLIAEVGVKGESASPDLTAPLIGMLPGSKASKLAQGVPLLLAVTDYLKQMRPEIDCVVPVAPTLDIRSLVNYADATKNPVMRLIEGGAGELVFPTEPDQRPYLKTASGFRVELWTETPAYDLLSRCTLCLTTVGANTAELGSLGIPMIVLLPTNQLDAMRSWDGLPGLLANLPGVGTNLAKLFNWLALRRLGLLAWPNIWAKAPIVPEVVGRLTPPMVGDMVLDFLDHPEKLQEMRDRLRAVRGQPGAAQKLVEIVAEELVIDRPGP